MPMRAWRWGHLPAALSSTPVMESAGVMVVTERLHVQVLACSAPDFLLQPIKRARFLKSMLPGTHWCAWPWDTVGRQHKTYVTLSTTLSSVDGCAMRTRARVDSWNMKVCTAIEQLSAARSDASHCQNSFTSDLFIVEVLT